MHKLKIKARKNMGVIIYNLARIKLLLFHYQFAADVITNMKVQRQTLSDKQIIYENYKIL